MKYSLLPGAAGGRYQAMTTESRTVAKQHRHQDRQHLVHPAPAAAGLVEAVEVEDDGEENEGDRQQRQVGLDRRHVLGDRDDLHLEAEEPGGDVRESGGEDVAGEIDAFRDAVALTDQEAESLTLDATAGCGSNRERMRSAKRYDENASDRARKLV